MITKALQFTLSSLDQFLKTRMGLDESKVVLNNLIEGNGSIPQINQNKIVISLINIEKETTKPFYNRTQRLENGNYSEVRPSERYNLDILISSNFDNYSEALKFLNAIILFFQINSTLDSNSSTNIPLGLSKLEFEIEKITYRDMQSLWTAMGAKYQPSVIYKMRLITIQGDEADGFVPEIKKIANTVMS